MQSASVGAFTRRVSDSGIPWKRTIATIIALMCLGGASAEALTPLRRLCKLPVGPGGKVYANTSFSTSAADVCGDTTYAAWEEDTTCPDHHPRAKIMLEWGKTNATSGILNRIYVYNPNRFPIDIYLVAVVCGNGTAETLGDLAPTITVAAGSWRDVPREWTQSGDYNLKCNWGSLKGGKGVEVVIHAETADRGPFCSIVTGADFLYAGAQPAASTASWCGHQAYTGFGPVEQCYRSPTSRTYAVGKYAPLTGGFSATHASLSKLDGITRRIRAASADGSGTFDFYGGPMVRTGFGSVSFGEQRRDLGPYGPAIRWGNYNFLTARFYPDGGWQRDLGPHKPATVSGPR